MQIGLKLLNDIYSIFFLVIQQKQKKKIDRWRIHWWNSVIIIKNKVCCKKDILLMSILLEFPFAIVQGAYLTSLKPTGNAMEVEGMLKYFR